MVGYSCVVVKDDGENLRPTMSLKNNPDARNEQIKMASFSLREERKSRA